MRSSSEMTLLRTRTRVLRAAYVQVHRGCTAVALRLDCNEVHECCAHRAAAAAGRADEMAQSPALLGTFGEAPAKVKVAQAGHLIASVEPMRSLSVA